jgi:hypothetical protein
MINTDGYEDLQVSRDSDSGVRDLVDEGLAEGSSQSLITEIPESIEEVITIASTALLDHRLRLDRCHQ